MPRRQCGDAADGVDHARAGEVAVAFAEAEVRAEGGEPAAAPGPVGEKRIGERAHHEGRDDEGGELPALGAGAGDDGQRGVHEHHLEQEDHHDADVIGAALRQEDAVLAEQAEGLAEDVDGESRAQRGRAAEVGDRRRRRPSGCEKPISQ